MRLGAIHPAVAATVLLLACTAPARAADPAPAAAFDPAVARRISIQELTKRLDAGTKVVIVDSRGSVDGSMIKGAVHVPNDDLETWAKTVAKDTLIVTYCA